MMGKQMRGWLLSADITYINVRYRLKFPMNSVPGNSSTYMHAFKFKSVIIKLPLHLKLDEEAS